MTRQYDSEDPDFEDELDLETDDDGSVFDEYFDDPYEELDEEFDEDDPEEHPLSTKQDRRRRYFRGGDD